MTWWPFKWFLPRHLILALPPTPHSEWLCWGTDDLRHALSIPRPWIRQSAWPNATVLQIHYRGPKEGKSRTMKPNGHYINSFLVFEWKDREVERCWRITKYMVTWLWLVPHHPATCLHLMNLKANWCHWKKKEENKRRKLKGGRVAPLNELKKRRRTSKLSRLRGSALIDT